jgi:CheY-like chemotaxis protein
MLREIFGMFRQVDKTLDRAHGGLGIGLTLVKQLVELHGGTVEARSEGPGHGSEFVVTLPVLTGRAKVAIDGDGAHTRAPLPPPLHHRILVVDDVEASAKTLAMMLRSIDQKADAMTDATGVVSYVEAHRPDVVFLDIAMPGMNGYDIARRLRQQPHLSDTVLIALTGYGQDEDRRKAFEAGFNYHLTKPASIDALENLLSLLPISGTTG